MDGARESSAGGSTRNTGGALGLGSMWNQSAYAMSGEVGVKGEGAGWDREVGKWVVGGGTAGLIYAGDGANPREEGGLLLARDEGRGESRICPPCSWRCSVVEARPDVLDLGGSEQLSSHA